MRVNFGSQHADEHVGRKHKKRAIKCILLHELNGLRHGLDIGAFAAVRQGGFEDQHGEAEQGDEAGEQQQPDPLAADEVDDEVNVPKGMPIAGHGLAGLGEGEIKHGADEQQTADGKGGDADGELLVPLEEGDVPTVIPAVPPHEAGGQGEEEQVEGGLNAKHEVALETVGQGPGQIPKSRSNFSVRQWAQ